MLLIRLSYAVVMLFGLPHMVYPGALVLQISYL